MLCIGMIAILVGTFAITRPDTPGVTVTNIAASGEIHLRWNAVESAKSYKIYRASDDEDDYSHIHTTKNAEYIDSTAESGHTYRYYVKAVSALWVPSSPSEEITCSRILPQPVIALSGEDATGKTKISWNRVEGTDHYSLYRSYDKVHWDLLKTTTGTGFTDTEAQVGENCYYRLQAVAPNADASSAYSDIQSRVCALPAPEVSVFNDEGTGRLILQWKPVDGAAGYEVFRAEGQDGPFREMGITEDIFYEDLSGTPETAYRYQVLAIAPDTAANSAHSAETGGICDLARPEVTAGNDPATGHVVLSWETVPGSVGYEIYWASREDGEYELLNTAESGPFTDTAGTVEEHYFYRVRAAAENPEANSALSTPQEGTFSLPCPVVTGGTEAATGAVELHWEAVEGAVKYEIYRSDTSDGIYEKLYTTKKDSYTDTSGLREEVYYYKVLAVASDPDANSALSAELEKAFALPCPTISVSNHATNGRVKISWKEVSGAVGYEVYRASSKDGDYRYLKDSDNTVCIDTSGTAEKTYYYKVIALAENSAADSGYSAGKSGTYHYPKTITLTAETNSKGKPTLEWNEIKNAEKYRVYRSLLRDSGYYLVTTTTGTDYTNSGAMEGVTFYYRIKAVDDEGEVIKTSNTASAVCELSKKETLKTRYVKAHKVWLYQAPDIGSETIALRYMDKLKLGADVTGTSIATWYRVFYDDQLYYMRIEDEDEVLATKKRKFKYTGETKRQQQIIDLALEISEEWKTTYAHNQSDGVPNSKGVYGFDCTGLVKYIFGTVMQKTVPTFRLYADIETLYETDSIYNAGYPGEFFASDVKKKNIQPGDILFFTSLADGSDSDQIGHCGIYLGNNEFVHSTSAWDDAVCIVPLTGSYAENLVAIRRYLPKTVTPANTKVRLSDANAVYSLYTERSRKSSVVTNVSGGDTVTVLYTDNADWAYVQAENGKKGFILVQYFK